MPRSIPTVHITDSEIRKLSPHGESYLWDDKLRGFGVRSTGQTQTFIVKYRVGGGTGQQRRFKLGSFGTLNAVEARARAKEVLQAVARGEDPAGTRSDMRSSPTIKEAFAVFLREHVEAKRKPRTLASYKDSFNRHIDPAIGSVKVRDLRLAHVEKLHAGLFKTPTGANRAIAALSKFCSWAETRELRDLNSNPCRHVEKFKESRRERYLTGTEIDRLRAVLDAAHNEPPQAVAAIRLLLMTGARHGEIVTMTWPVVDLKRGVIRPPDSKSGARNIFAGPDAVKVLEALPRLNSNEHVICGRREGGRFHGLQNVWERLRKKAGLEDVRLHDLRHTAASLAILEQGASLSLVGKMLGHKSHQSTARYTHIADDAAATLAALVGARIAGSRS